MITKNSRLFNRGVVMREASIIKKRQFIEATYQVILKEGVKGIKIRTLANMIGCTSAVLYKYFDNLDHLITLASIRFLKDYMKIFQEMNEVKNKNPIKFSENMWKIFIDESFKHPDIYNILFFGEYSSQLGDTIYEYFQLFSEEMFEMDGYTVSILFNGNLEDRELILLRTAANKKMISLDDAKILSTLETMIYQGYLLRCINGKMEADEAAEKCHYMIESVMYKYAGKHTGR